MRAVTAAHDAIARAAVRLLHALGAAAAFPAAEAAVLAGVGAALDTDELAVLAVGLLDRLAAARHAAVRRCCRQLLVTVAPWPIPCLGSLAVPATRATSGRQTTGTHAPTGRCVCGSNCSRLLARDAAVRVAHRRLKIGRRALLP